MNLLENVWKELYTKIMKTILQRKESINSLNHYNLVHEFFRLPKGMKLPNAKTAVDKEWDKLEKISSMAADESHKQKKVIAEERKEGKFFNLSR